jgi:hypothetical protein
VFSQLAGMTQIMFVASTINKRGPRQVGQSVRARMTKTTVSGSRSNNSEDVGVVARAATAPEEAVMDLGRRIV